MSEDMEFKMFYESALDMLDGIEISLRKKEGINEDQLLFINDLVMSHEAFYSEE